MEIEKIKSKDIIPTTITEEFSKIKMQIVEYLEIQSELNPTKSWIYRELIDMEYRDILKLSDISFYTKVQKYMYNEMIK